MAQQLSKWWKQRRRLTSMPCPQVARSSGPKHDRVNRWGGSVRFHLEKGDARGFDGDARGSEALPHIRLSTPTFPVFVGDESGNVHHMHQEGGGERVGGRPGTAVVRVSG